MSVETSDEAPTGRYLAPSQPWRPRTAHPITRRGWQPWPADGD